MTAVVLDSKPQLMRTAAKVSLVCGLCHATGALALGFGDIRLNSALNQPLQARLDLVSLSNTERGSLSVRIASPELFQRFGIERTELADKLRIKVDEAGGNRVTVHLSTRRPVREPFLRFLIEADTAEGRALREYTVLLDPPGSAPMVADGAPAASATPSVAPSPSSDTTGSTASASPRPGTYGPVAAGETLFGIAGSTQRPGTTLAQMQIAIFRDNPKAFNGNMNLLLRGAVLSIPRAGRVRQVDNAEAIDAIHAQRREMAATMPQNEPAAPVVADATRQSASATTAATLRLEAPPDGSGGVGAGGGGRARFGRLVEPDFSALASAPTPATVEPEKPQTVPADTTAAAAAESVGVPAAHAEAMTAPSQAGAVETPSAQPTSATAPVAASATPLAAMHEQDVAGVPGGLFSPRNLLLLLALVVLGGALLLWHRRRQYKPVPLDFTAGDPEEQTYRGVPYGETTDADDAIVSGERSAPAFGPAAPGVTESAPAQLQDADGQMKLGLFDEARQTLQQGLRQQPEHAGLQDKLLELDYLSGDVSAFARDVDRFESSLAASGVRWAGIAAMGRVLLPDDPRFAKTVPAANVPVANGASPVAKVPPVSPQAAAVQRDRNESPQPVPADEAAAAGEDTSRFTDTVDEDMASRPPFVTDPEDSYAAEDQNGYLESSMVERSSQARVFSIDDEPASRQPGDNSVAAPAQRRSDSAINLDSGASDLDYDWNAQRVDVAGEREHDLGDDPGMAFDLDTSPFPKNGPRTPGAESSARAPGSISPIAAGEFDMDGESSPPTADSGAADPVEIRLDLARMYIDMEDHSVARELLQESMAEGNHAQRDTAQQLLRKIG